MLQCTSLLIACIASLHLMPLATDAVSMSVNDQSASVTTPTAEQDALVERFVKDNRGSPVEIRASDWEGWNATFDQFSHAALLARLQTLKLEYASALGESDAQLRRDLRALDLATQARIEDSVLERLQKVEPVNALDKAARAARDELVASIKAEAEVTGIRHATLKAAFADSGRRFSALTRTLRSARALGSEHELLGQAIDASISELLLRGALNAGDVYQDYEKPITLNALLVAMSVNDACIAQTLRDEGILMDAAARRPTHLDDSVLRPILRQYWEQSVPLTLEWFAKLAKQSRLLSQTDTPEDAQALGRKFIDSAFTRNYRERQWLLFHACVRDLAESIGAKCGSSSRECFLGHFAQAIAGRIAENPWLTANRKALMETLSCEEETRVIVDAFLDRFAATARSARAEFATKAMRIREILLDEYPDERDAARMHSAARRALWQPHELAIVELRSMLAPDSCARFDAALEEGRRENPRAFGDSPHDLDRVE